MYTSHQPLNDEDHYSEEGEIEIADLNDEEDKPERGVRRSRSIGRSRGGPNARAPRSSSGDSVSSQSSRRSKASSRSRSNSVGRMSHRQRSRAMMASPSKYGRGLRRGDSDVHSTATTVADDLSDEPSPSLPEGDNDSNHQLRKRLSEMTEMATKSPSAYRQRKQMLKKRLSSQNSESLAENISNLSMSPCQSTKKKVVADSDGISQLDPELDATPSVHSASIDRQQRKEQAALEEVMSMMKSQKKNHHWSLSRSGRSSDTTQMRSSRKSGTTGSSKSPLRRTQSLNVGAPSTSRSHKPDRRSHRTSEAKKERRNMVKSNLGMFVEDD